MYGRGPEKIPEAGAHREISRFPGGPVRHCFWGPKNKIMYFDPILFVPKTQIFLKFLKGLRQFRVK